MSFDRQPRGTVAPDRYVALEDARSRLSGVSDDLAVVIHDAQQEQGSVTPFRFISEGKSKNSIQFLAGGNTRYQVNKSQQLRIPKAFLQKNKNSLERSKRASDNLSALSANNPLSKLNTS